jgi:hypothetical protein
LPVSEGLNSFNRSPLPTAIRYSSIPMHDLGYFREHLDLFADMAAKSGASSLQKTSSAKRNETKPATKSRASKKRNSLPMPLFRR